MVFNVRWCAYNTDYNTDNCVSKLLLDILLLRGLVLIAVLYPILRIAEAGAYRIVKYHTQLAVSSLCITGRHDSVTTVKHTLLLLASSVCVLCALCGVYVCCGGPMMSMVDLATVRMYHTYWTLRCSILY